MKNSSPNPELVFLAIRIMVDTAYVKVYYVGDILLLIHWRSRIGFLCKGMDDD